MPRTAACSLNAFASSGPFIADTLSYHNLSHFATTRGAFCPSGLPDQRVFDPLDSRFAMRGGSLRFRSLRVDGCTRSNRGGRSMLPLNMSGKKGRSPPAALPRERDALRKRASLEVCSWVHRPGNSRRPPQEVAASQSRAGSQRREHSEHGESRGFQPRGGMSRCTGAVDQRPTTLSRGVLSAS